MQPLPPPSDLRWRTILAGGDKLRLQSLVLNVFVTRARMALRNSRPDQALVDWIREFQAVIEENGRLPEVQADLRLMFGGT